ncbi:ribosome-inactivating protein cucurmosin-like [Humulus lupulus]|uniref:ribosome-inactivating protein cucurmosin-like n=1 Tax=Humulus lupulus TaxID=3486 RepID=UPI002B400E7F|nr:ribosome-inactivating protein cucurmosin-like [Humulus lupulus]
MKRSNVMVQIVVATWIRSWSSSISIAFGLGISYSDVTFDTVYTNDIVDRYKSFIQSLRDKLKSKTESHGIPVLPAESDKRFVYATLYNKHVNITFAIYAVNAYVVAYQVDAVEKRCYFFEEFPSDSKAGVFDQCPQKKALNFPTTYGSLGDREKTPLGFEPLSHCLYTFNKFDGTGDDTDLRKGLLVVIQMVSEAARFIYIEQKMVNKFKPEGDIISHENKWEDLSKQIQESKNGEFNCKKQTTRNTLCIMLQK